MKTTISVELSPDDLVEIIEEFEAQRGNKVKTGSIRFTTTKINTETPTKHGGWITVLKNASYELETKRTT